MEYICAGDLFSYIKKRSKLTETVAKFIFKQIVLAIQYIHRNNIVHRDIKLDNILIDLDNNVKICDFGVSKIIKKGDILFDQCGTPTYIAPEILKNKGYDGFPVDIWSAGVVLYAMLNGNVPFKGGDLNELHKLIIEGEYKPIKHISKEAAHLLKCLLEVDPTKRIKSDDILFHPWLMGVDLNFFSTQNLFTNAENILLAKSNVDYSDINNKENMVENFDIKNLDTEEDNSNTNVKTKSIILAPFNSSLSSNSGENSYENEENDFNNPDLIVKNGIIKFSPKTKDLNRNYELNNNQDIDNGIVILSNDSDEKGKKEESPIEGSQNSKINNKHFLPVDKIELNKKGSEDEDKECESINSKILEKVEILGYNKEYIKYCWIKKEFNYATATYRILEKYFQEE
jgi:serine/threonine protein kinase